MRTHRHDVTPAQDQWHCLHLHWSGQPAESSSSMTAMRLHQSTMQRLAVWCCRAPPLPLCWAGCRVLLLLLYSARSRPAKLLHCFDELRHYAQLLESCSHAAVTAGSQLPDQFFGEH